MFRRLALYLGLWFGGAPAWAGEPVTLRVLTTLAPIYSWAAAIAGEFATVENLLPADVGPHHFQFRPKDLKKIQAAQIVILNGLGLETWLERVLTNNSSGRAPCLIRTTDGLSPEFIYHLPTLTLDPTSARPGGGHAHDHDHVAAGEVPNPHLWLNPIYAQHAVSNILKAFCEHDAAHASKYRKNAAAYLAQLAELDQSIKSVCDGLPHKAIVTYHDAFPYFARRYGFELVGVVEEIPAVSPSPKYLSELSKVIKARKVQVIFTEPQFEPRLVKQITQDLGIQFTALDVLETGKPSVDFYIQGMKRNLQVLTKALK